MFNLAKHVVRSTMKSYSNMTGAEIAYNKLIEYGIKDVFPYSGGSIMPLIDKFYQGEINYYINSHEQNSGHAATGYAKSLGGSKPGIAITTSGPGLTNIVTPLLDANNDSTPLIVFSGQVALQNIGSDAFQEAPAVEITKSITKWSYLVKSVDELPFVIDRAFEVAMDGKKGSVHIDLPKCVLQNTISEDVDYLVKCFNNLIEEEGIKNTLDSKVDMKINNYNIKFGMPSKNITSKNYKSISKIAEVINSSKKPILYIGQGCNPYPDKLLKFVTKTKIPFTTTIHAKGIIDEDHNLSMQWCGMHGSAAANYALQESDCIIAIGSRFDDRTTGNIDKYAPVARENKKIIHCDISNNQICKVLDSDYNWLGDSGEFLSELTEEIDSNISSREWLDYLDELRIDNYFKYRTPENNKINTPMAISAINKVTMGNSKFRENTLISTGVGNHQMMTYQFIHGNYCGKIHSSGSLGVMGAGLPYAIGMQIANPDKLVIDIDGDSSFLMTMSDMKTIMEYNLPVKIAIMNDSKQMMVNIWERLFFEERYTATINNKNPDFKNVAESFGLKSFKILDNENIEEITKEFLEWKGPALCEYIVEPEICLPLVGPGKALDEMILFDKYHFDQKYDIKKNMDISKIPS